MKSNTAAFPSDISVSSMGRRRLHQTASETMRETTDEVLDALVLDSSFFGQAQQSFTTRPIPAFEPSEVHIGDTLGTGEFGVVSEVVQLCLSEECICDSPLLGGQRNLADVLPQQDQVPTTIALVENSEPYAISVIPTSVGHSRAHSVTFADDTKDAAPQTFESPPATVTVDIAKGDISVYDGHSCCDDEEDLSATRDRMASNTHRKGVARYAIKRLRRNLDKELMVDAAIDLACEAMFLQSISHSNIIRLRGTVGTPGTPQFALMLDRLTCTLEGKIGEWRARQDRSSGFLGRFGRDKNAIAALIAEQFTAALDLARALRHLHGRKIIYRDLKTDNVGFDVRGYVQLFDFGLAKELRSRDLVEKPDGYEATGLTGTRRYMAPEVVRCRVYGLSADVYSYSLVLWQIFALQTPFPSYNANQHYENVVAKGKRPPRIPWLPSQTHAMMEEGWSEDRRQRPGFLQVCQILQVELASRTDNVSTTDRSTHLMDRSARSGRSRVDSRA
jgi:serine/threonine protein kinase